MMGCSFLDEVVCDYFTAEVLSLPVFIIPAVIRAARVGQYSNGLPRVARW
jgi:hypothetical protein